MNGLIDFPDAWEMPKNPGFGTFPGPYKYQEIDSYYNAVKSAIETGYGHIDHAQTYLNDYHVGKAIVDSGKRDQIFITSKLHPENNSYLGALEGINKALQNLGLSYLDMFLIHYPCEGDPYEAWKGLIECKSRNLCRHCGVSNFEIKHLEKLYQMYGRYPEVNQIEYHPLLFSHHLKKLIDFCNEKDILVEGYCPLAWYRPELFNNQVIIEIASNQQKPKSQIVLKWAMQHGVRPIPGTRNLNHLRENFGPYDFVLSEAEISKINSLGISLRISKSWGWDPTAQDC